MAMDASDVLRELEARGTEQNRKLYPRHGVIKPVFGVGYADLKALAKRIGTDQAMAAALRGSGVHDARVLAAMIDDPMASTIDSLESWCAEVDDRVEADALARFVARTPHAARLAREWTEDRSEWPAAIGWTVLAVLAPTDPSLASEDLLDALEAIERTIHDRPNQVRHAMNNALIAIGMRDEDLRDRTLEAADRIGRVEVDHGATGCKTPEARPYLLKSWDRKRSRAAPRGRSDGRGRGSKAS